MPPFRFKSPTTPAPPADLSTSSAPWSPTTTLKTTALSTSPKTTTTLSTSPKTKTTTTSTTTTTTTTSATTTPLSTTSATTRRTTPKPVVRREEIAKDIPRVQITKNQLYNRVGFPPATTPSPVPIENEVPAEVNPSMKDIQSILENLLFLATIEPDLLTNNNQNNNHVASTTHAPVTKEMSNFHYENSHEPILKNNEPEVTTKGHLKALENAPQIVPQVNSYSGVRDFERPYLTSNGGFPLDRFRIQAQSSNIKNVPSAEKVNTSTKPSQNFNIWDMLTTKKPLILDTEVVTSTSFDVKYGGTTQSLMPVYVPSSTIRNMLQTSNRVRYSTPEVVIPVISGEEIKYIKVNRTRPQYPKVVIVNLAESEHGLPQDVPVPFVDENASDIESQKFIEDVTNLLNLMKKHGEVVRQPSEDQKENSLADNLLKRFGVPVTIPAPMQAEIDNTGTTSQSFSFWDALSNFSKLYFSGENIQNENVEETQVGLEIPPVTPPMVSDKDFKYNRYSPISDTVYHIPHQAPNWKPSRKSGKSLKFTPTLTLFVVGGGDGRDAKVISVSGRSPIVSSSKRENSPIHTFTFKEGQSLEELLTEIFDSISEDKLEANETSPLGINSKDDGQSQLDTDNDSSLPAGEDSLKVIEALSKLLADHYDNYNLMFGATNHDGDTSISTSTASTSSTTPATTSPSTTKPTTTTQAKVGSTPLKNSSISDTINEISSTTENRFTQSTKLSNTNFQTSHKYYHDLFPVMTRPMNPINTSSTPKLETTTEPVGLVTSIDVSYSMLTGDKNISFPVWIRNRTAGCSEDEFECLNGKCIPKLARCNMIRDCSDNSDEKDCTCSDILKSQHYTRKICDGIIDCWDKSDETNCDWCSPGHFICTGYQKCVKPESVCDGLPDCPNGDDERDCVTIAPNVVDANSIDYFDEGYLMVRRKGKWGKLCVDNFEDEIAKADVSWSVVDLGEAVCKTLTFDSSSRVEKAYDSSPPIFRSVNTPYYEIDITYGSPDISRPRSLRSDVSHLKRSLWWEEPQPPLLKGSFSYVSEAFKANAIRGRHTSHLTKRDASSDFELSLLFQETKCLKRDVVKVQCKNLQCGVRPRATTQQARIVGGSNSSPGAWPWHAALYKEGEYQCGATLINQQWLISAGHCFYSARNSYWVARMGALRRGTKFPSPFEQLRALSHIFIHPQYVSQGFINDISLLRMKEPIKLNDYVRPICLPSPGAEIKDGQRCTLVGWGQLFEVKKVFPDTLQEVEVPLISTNECRKRTVFLPLYRITEDMFCAGYDRGGRDACLGDSGGPLMCQKSDGRYEMMGVTSNGYGCARPLRPGVYTKVVNYLSWIGQVLKLANDKRVIPLEAQCEGFRCPLGQCIPSSGICNGRVECSDGSDEKDCP